MGINEKTGEVFSVAVENAPVAGCTVSKAVAEVAGGYVAHFSLAAGTDISAETYSAPKVWLVASGDGEAFTVAFGTADAVKACDYLGIVSGNKTPDKVAKSGFTVTKSEFVDAPVVNELPLVLECKLVSMNEENCNVVGKIVNCAVEETAMTDGKPDAGKMKPICFDTCQHAYRIMGDVVARAFSCGREV